MGSRVESVPCPRSIYGESSDGVVEETSTIPEHFSIFAFYAWSDRKAVVRNRPVMQRTAKQAKGANTCLHRTSTARQ